MRFRFRVLLLLALLGLGVTACNRNNPETNKSDQTPPITPSTNSTQSNLALSSYKVEWGKVDIPEQMKAGKKTKFKVAVTNSSDATWPAKGTDEKNRGRVSLSYHWLGAEGDKPVELEGIRTPFPHDIKPGETFTGEMEVKAPAEPGSYRLQVTLTHQMVTWFEAKKAKTIIAPVKVVR